MTRIIQRQKKFKRVKPRFWVKVLSDDRRALEKLKRAGIEIEDRRFKRIILGKTGGFVFKVMPIGKADLENIKEFFRDHRRLFKSGAPLVEPKKLQIIRAKDGSTLAVWQEKRLEGKSVFDYMKERDIRFPKEKERHSFS